MSNKEELTTEYTEEHGVFCTKIIFSSVKLQAVQRTAVFRGKKFLLDTPSILAVFRLTT